MAGRRRRGAGRCRSCGRVRAAGWTVDAGRNGGGAAMPRRLAAAATRRAMPWSPWPAATARSTRWSTGLPAMPGGGWRWRCCRSAPPTCWPTNWARSSRRQAIARTTIAGDELLDAAGRAANRARPRCFTLMAGVGFDAHVVAGLDRRCKRAGASGAYVSAPAPARPSASRYRVAVDGVAHEAAFGDRGARPLLWRPLRLAPEAGLGEPVLHVCLFDRGGRSAPLRYALALMLGLLPRLADYRVVPGREVRISVLSDAGEAGHQPGADRRRRRAHLAGVDWPRRRRGADVAAGLRLGAPLRAE